MSIIENALDKVRRTPTAVPGSAAPTLQAPPPEVPIDPAPRVVHTHQQRITIDFNLLRAQGEIPEAGLERRFADYYREIKRPLIQSMLGPEARPESRLVLVTSALPGEGKTFTALNLALSVARERDVSVLLVDADLPKGHLSRTFGLQGVPGLLDALADEAVDVESLIIGTDIRGLEILPAGNALEGAAELVASARMAQIATRLTARHPRRLVLFDSAPLLASSEARALKQVPGKILMVTRAGKTPRHALLDAIALIDKTKLHGLVLNDAHGGRSDGYYTHYGYSGYGAPEVKR
jgi:exopolysaccharide/PEP-CTERM locus tyrosine autokinase